MHDKHCLVFSFLFISCSFVVNAQDMKEAFRERIREMNVSTNMLQSQQQPSQMEQNTKNDEVLKVSPTTKLPTKGDRLKMLNPPSKYKVNMSATVTNAPPVNRYPVGTVKYVFDGRRMRMESVAGTTPRGATFDAGPIRKRHKKNENVLKLLEK